MPPSQPFLPLSDSGALYDSDESGAEDDEDNDDAFLSDTQITEHSDPNSYRYGPASPVGGPKEVYIVFTLSEDELLPCV